MLVGFHSVNHDLTHSEQEQMQHQVIVTCFSFANSSWRDLISSQETNKVYSKQTAQNLCYRSLQHQVSLVLKGIITSQTEHVTFKSIKTAESTHTK